ncbi:SusC/RagA family TonB-linked outer membrane protein [Sphingobacterium kitahiroshimense]|uniref:SusC/RagA family TonB-linked outer membrane protein n=1 Tax=Sphingobacterium kitahiroshimense TaxID=470446 RepID=A0ABV0BNF2_9SPHI
MKTVFITLLCSVWVLLCNAQQKDPIWVKGQVHATEERKPLPGVTVKVFPGTDIAATDMNGDFTIKVNSLQDSVQISIVGYTTQTFVASHFQKQSKVYLTKKMNYLDEAMVNTGYQSLQTKDITGAVDVVSNAMLNQQTGLNIVDRLNNITSSVRFDNQPIYSPDLQKLNFSVRGLSTINGNLDPLIVLDGFIYEGNIQNIDPNNVESISILKDAAASSIWGARAGNGVILITSKKGSFQAGQRTKISLSNTFITKDKPDLKQLYEIPNKEFIDIEKMLFDKGYYFAWLNFQPHLAMTPVINLLNNRQKGLVSATDSAKTMNWLLAQDGRQNYMDEFYTTPFSNQLSLNINGGSEFNAYGLGVGYTTDRTHLDANSKKLNIQLSNSFRPVERLQIDLNVQFTDQKDLSGKPDYSKFKYTGKSVPYRAFRDEMGQEVSFDYEFNKPYLDNKFPSPYLDWGYYPLSDYKYETTERKLNEWFATTGIRYQIFPFLSANASFQWQRQEADMEHYYAKESYYTRVMINKFSAVDPFSGTIKYNVPIGAIRMLDKQTANSYTARGQLDFNKVIGKHRITGIMGAEARQNTVAGFNNSIYGYNKIPLTSVPVDHVTQFLNVAPTFSSGVIPGQSGLTKMNNRFVSFYSNWNEIYNDKYGISASFRQDGGNIFGANTNDKWSPLWSVGASWQLDKEEFFKVQWVDYLKWRTTFGYSGNVDLRKTPYPVAVSGVDSYTNYPILTIQSLNDPSLRWEKVSTLNFGIDFSFFQNRISGTVDHYIKRGKDLYGLANYDYTAWGVEGTITKNVGSMEGKGWDFTINSRNTTGAVAWNTRLLLGLNKNKTTEYFAAPFSGIASYLGNGNIQQPIVGKPLHGLSGYTWMGLNDQGMPQGLLNGQVSTDYIAMNQMAIDHPEGNETVSFIGSSKPQVFGNLINSVAYKGFELAANISYKGDYYFNKPVTDYYLLFFRGDAYPDFENRWRKPGDEAKTNVPVMTYPYDDNSNTFYNYAAINVLKADHIRLEYISLAWQKKWQLGYRSMNVRLFANASNLGILWRANKEHIDPEFAYRLSPVKTYSIGVHIDY